MSQRPVFDAKLGAAFATLREERTGWSQNHAGARADSRGLPGLTRNILWRLEQGRIKHPSARTLRSMATLYGAPYEEVVQLVVSHVYGVDVKVTASNGRSRAIPPSPAVRKRTKNDRKVAEQARRLARELLTLAEQLGDTHSDATAPSHLRKLVSSLSK